MIKIYKVNKINKIDGWVDVSRGMFLVDNLESARKIAEYQLSLSNERRYAVQDIVHEDFVYTATDDYIKDIKEKNINQILEKLDKKEIDLLKNHFSQKSYNCSFCNNTRIIGDHLGAVTCSCKSEY